MVISPLIKCNELYISISLHKLYEVSQYLEILSVFLNRLLQQSEERISGIKVYPQDEMKEKKEPHRLFQSHGIHDSLRYLLLHFSDHIKDCAIPVFADRHNLPGSFFSLGDAC